MCSFKTRYFSRWFRKAGLSDGSLCQAVDEMEKGLIDANLGGGVVKKRIALVWNQSKNATSLKAIERVSVVAATSCHVSSTTVAWSG